jgi:hypothetical protein
MGSSAERRLKESATQKQLDYVADLRAKVTRRAARELMNRVEPDGSTSATYKLYLKYVTYKTIPEPSIQGEASSLISTFKDYRDPAAVVEKYEGLYSDERGAVVRHFSEYDWGEDRDEAFREEFKGHITSRDLSVSELTSNVNTFQNRVLDTFYDV